MTAKGKSMNTSDKFKSYAITGVCLYVAITVLVIGYVASIFQTGGLSALKEVLRQGPLSNVAYTILYVAIMWVLLGSILVLLLLRVINRGNIFCFVSFYLFAFTYLNFLRERDRYGDLADYVKAAFNVYLGEPLHNRYLYPPLWATCLQLLVPFGKKAMVLACLSANYLSLLLFFILLYQALKRYGFYKNFSVLAVFAILCGNVPVIRNMYYVQVNLHVINLILLSLLFYGKYTLLSALALSLAVHLKVSPVVLILPFLLNRDWKWLIQFLIVSVAVVIFTSLMNGFEYYPNFLSNVMSKFGGAGFTFRQNSIDSLMRATFAFLNIETTKAQYLVLVLKLALLAASLGILLKTIRHKVYYEGENKLEVIYNSYIVLLFLMTVLSPIIWEHHPVFIIFPFLVMLKKISTVENLILYLLAYILIFIIPTFDFYPFSYHRLLGLMLCYPLLFKFSRAKKQVEVGWFEKVNQALECKFA